MLHPRVPSLAMAELTIAKCLFISDFFGPSGIPPIIVLIFDMSEHDIMSADAGLNAKAAATRLAADMTANFIVISVKKGRA
jgi:hypothetical protein